MHTWRVESPLTVSDTPEAGVPAAPPMLTASRSPAWSNDTVSAVATSSAALAAPLTAWTAVPSRPTSSVRSTPSTSVTVRKRQSSPTRSTATDTTASRRAVASCWANRSSATRAWLTTAGANMSGDAMRAMANTPTMDSSRITVISSTRVKPRLQQARRRGRPAASRAVAESVHISSSPSMAASLWPEPLRQYRRRQHPSRRRERHQVSVKVPAVT